MCACSFSYCGTYFNTTRNQFFAIFLLHIRIGLNFDFVELLNLLRQCKQWEKFNVGLVLLRFQ